MNSLEMKNQSLNQIILFSLLIFCFLANPVLTADTNAAQVSDKLNNRQSPQSKPIRDKWAVVIGIDQFKDKSIPELRYSAKDAKDFARFLVEKGNFAKDHVKLILNEKATENNIRNVLGDKWLPRRAMPDDLIVIFVSSHGSPKELDRRGANYLVAHDTYKDQLYTSGIKLEDLGPDIQDRTQCNRVVLLLDACNSGAAKVGGKGLYRSQNFDVEQISSRAGEGLVVISSSSQDQKSWESKRYKNSVFTKNLIDTLKDPKQSEEIDLVYEGLKNKVEQEVKFDRQVMQTPVMKSKWKGIPLKITAKPTQPRVVKGSPDETLTVAQATAAKIKKSDQAKGTVNSTTKNSLVSQNQPKKIALAPKPTRIAPQINTTDPDTRIAIISVSPSHRFILKSKKRARRRARKALSQETFSSLPRALRDQIARELSMKTGKTVVEHEEAALHVKSIFRKQKPNFYFPQRNEMKAVSKALKARYLIMVQITQMQISEKPAFGPQASIQITTKIIDGKTGFQKAVVKERFIKPNSRQRIEKKTILRFALPKLANDIAKDVAKKI